MENFKLFLEKDEVSFLDEYLKWMEVKSKIPENVEIAKRLRKKIEKVTSQKEKDYPYIEGLSKEAKELFFRVEREYEFNLYHSFASVFNQTKLTKSSEEYYQLYKNNYKEKRPIIFEFDSEAREICNHVYMRLKRKQK